MGSQSARIGDQSTTDTTPEDVAALYSWANLRGAKYRDYSASRREHRAQVRYRAAKALLDRELKAQAEAESSAEAAEREAREAEACALAGTTTEPQQSRFAALRKAEAAALKAAADRVEAARRAEAAAHATVLALREERELVDAKASATQQARIYTESEALRKHLAGPQPRSLEAAEAMPQPSAELPMAAAIAEPEPVRIAEIPVRIKMGWQPLSETILGPEEDWQVSPVAADLAPQTEQARPAWLALPETSVQSNVAAELQGEERPMFPGRSDDLAAGAAHLDDAGNESLHVTQESESEAAPPTSAESLPRWLALREVLERSAHDPANAIPVAPSQIRTPLLAVFSIAGGVGATSLVAALGRALSAAGEKVVLIDTTSQALLPFYFGGKELRPGLIRTWSPPEGTGEPISIGLHDATQMNGDEDAQQQLIEQICSSGIGAERMLVDLTAPSTWLLRKLASLGPAVLVPLVPSMDSVIRLESTERLFRELSRDRAEPLLPYYVLNHFESSQPLHLDV
ncbi:MAG TPA: ParA family protein, partial [Acidobacteriaceae bacterium]|nr:ParA family protein [Acidobacteriaceae bacterium]